MTDHFKLHEFEYSRIAFDAGIDNRVPAHVIGPLHFTAAGMERVRAALDGRPIKVNSGYRSHHLNELVKGSKKSQHIKGEACDFVCPGFGTPYDICKKLEPMVRILGIDQLIYEGGWVHCSFTLRPRYSVLALQNGVYIQGVP